MSTTKPRITITLEETTALQLRRLSALTKNSQSALVAEVLEQAGPVFERLIVVLEAAEKATRSLPKGAVEGLELAQQRIEKQLGLALDDFTQATAPLFEQEKVQRRARKGPACGGGLRAGGGTGGTRKSGPKSTPKAGFGTLPNPLI